jgi:hypothetical protein
MKFVKIIASLVVGLASLGLMTTAHAQSSTFANFSDGGTNDFVFTNAGALSSFTSGEIPVKFFFDDPNSYDSVGTQIAANLLITGTVESGATSVGPNDYQPFSSLELQFTDASNDNLLTVNATPSGSSYPTLSGSDGGGSATLSASSTGRGSDVVRYTSSYLNFTNVTNENFGLSFSSIIDTSGPSSGTSGITYNTNAYLDSFIASGTGTFASTPAPLVPSSTPEPNTLLILAIAFGCLLMLGMYKKVQVTKS